MPAKGKRSLPIDAKLHAIISKAAIDRELHIYQLLWEMWHAYMALERQLCIENIEEGEKLSHAQYHDLLDIVLSAGGETADAIRTMLRSFAQQAQLALRKKKGAG